MMSGSPYGSSSPLMMETRNAQGFHSRRPKLSQTIPFQLINSKSHVVVPNVRQQSRTDENTNQNEDPFSVSYDVTLGADDFQNEVTKFDIMFLYSQK